MQRAISKNNPGVCNERGTESSPTVVADQNSGTSACVANSQHDIFFIEEIDVVPAESMLAHRT